MKADKAGSAQRLRFTEEERGEAALKKPAAGIRHAVDMEVRQVLHRKIREDEEDNIGLQAAHGAEQAGEAVLDAGRRLHHAGGSNPLSRAYQRRNIQKAYIAAKRGRDASLAGGRTAGAAGKAVKRSRRFFAGRRKHAYGLLALIAMLGFLLNALSACAPLMEAGFQAVVLGTHPAEEADVLAAEHAYSGMERDLQDELDHYALNHPEYDACVVDAQAIEHDPYALIALISAYHGGAPWTIDSAYGTLEMLFAWQYELTQSVQTETRYRTEGREGTEVVTDPLTGETWVETYFYTVEVPYVYSTRTVTLKNRNLSHAPVYIMSREKVGLYALYMSTLGNMPELFAGNPHASRPREPMRYDVPQELLNADPKLALLVEEANKRLGYPYVWGGYTPETSFDCSGFISWIFTETGVDDIGHLGATGLYHRSRHIEPEEAKPGDVIFFTGTLGEGAEGNDGVTHCGLYVGGNRMVHCGNPCSYADLTEPYWQQHFLGYGRLYEH